MNRYASRKFLHAVFAEVAFLGALGVCLYEPALRPYIPYFVGGIIAVVVGYGAANVWGGRGPAGPPWDM